MAERDTRPEATHRQRAELGQVPEVLIGPDGRHYAVLSNACSDLIPSVQFGNILVGPCVITRAVPLDPTPEEEAALDAQLVKLMEISRKQQRSIEFVVGAERRVLQWAIDPSTRVINPSTGNMVTPEGEVPVPAEPTPAPEPQPTTPDVGNPQS